MPTFETEHRLPRPVAEVFEFFLRPANLPRLAPPELQLRVEVAPPLLVLGAQVTVTGRRSGVLQRITSEVTALEPGARLVVEQRAGPFQRWVHLHQFVAAPDGTQVKERVEFEPPGGLLGLVVTAAVVEAELRWAFEYRAKVLKELLRVTR